MYNLTEVNPSEDLLSKVRGPYSTILADSSLAVSEPHGKDGTRTQEIVAISDDGIEGNLGTSCVQARRSQIASLFVGTKRAYCKKGCKVMKAWGFTYKSNMVWYKIRKDGGPDGAASGSIFEMSRN